LLLQSSHFSPKETELKLDENEKGIAGASYWARSRPAPYCE